jgi:drug/metabolite transporter (DMT)-like permease
MKRLSGMMSVVLGHFFLKEAGIRERLLGAVIMFIGVLFILLS